VGYIRSTPLRALWVCLVINPLLNALNESGYSYQLKSSTPETYTMCYLLYMDDFRFMREPQDNLINRLTL
jgi:hypothetical protein